MSNAFAQPFYGNVDANLVAIAEAVHGAALRFELDLCLSPECCLCAAKVFLQNQPLNAVEGAEQGAQDKERTSEQCG
jgi:hypothetical protein